MTKPSRTSLAYPIPDNLNRRFGNFFFLPHKDAKTLTNATEAELQLYMAQLVAEVTSPHLSTGNSEVRELLRQMGLINLWFFLKFIAGFSGPYDKLNDDLHLHMCNFRQSSNCMRNGAQAFAFIPRGMYKSTIFSHGANTWEITRNPNIRIAVINAILGKAEEFMRNSQRTFDRNEFYAWLYPEHVPGKGHKPWNDTFFVIPSRTRNFPDPTIKAMGATGAAEGGHYDLKDWDDLVGLEDLSNELQSSAGMEGKKRYFISNLVPLRVDETSRDVGVATRYAMDDAYQIPMENARQFVGYKNPDFVENPKGTWTIYYRMAMEDGEPIFPEVVSKETLDKIMHEDYWTYITQYMNDPQKTGLAEFYSMNVRLCQVFWDEALQDFVVRRVKDPNFEKRSTWLRLSQCDVVMSIDPAGTETGMTAKTSRTSIGVWAMDWNGDVYRLWEKVGYMDVNTMFNGIFEGHEKFGGQIRLTVIESNAMQRILKPLIDKEQERRGVWFATEAAPAKGDKTARIRNAFGRLLSRGQVWLAEGYEKNFIGEKNVFPMSKHKMDVLDESEKAMTSLVRPSTPEEDVLDEIDRLEQEHDRIENVVGY